MSVVDLCFDRRSCPNTPLYRYLIGTFKKTSFFTKKMFFLSVGVGSFPRNIFSLWTVESLRYCILATRLSRRILAAVEDLCSSRQALPLTHSHLYTPGYSVSTAMLKKTLLEKYPFTFQVSAINIFACLSIVLQ